MWLFSLYTKWERYSHGSNQMRYRQQQQQMKLQRSPKGKSIKKIQKTFVTVELKLIEIGNYSLKASGIKILYTPLLNTVGNVFILAHTEQVLHCILKQ